MQIDISFVLILDTILIFVLACLITPYIKQFLRLCDWHNLAPFHLSARVLFAAALPIAWVIAVLELRMLYVH